MLEPVTSAEIDMAAMAMAGMDAASAQLRTHPPASHRSSTEWDGDELTTMLREQSLVGDMDKSGGAGGGGGGGDDDDEDGDSVLCAGSPLADIDAMLHQLSSQLKKDARLPDTPDRL
jgi:hypothetical protein